MIAFFANRCPFIGAAISLAFASPCLAQASDPFPDYRPGACSGRGRAGEWTWVASSGFIALTNDHASRGTPRMIYTFSAATISSAAISKRTTVIAAHYLWLPEPTPFPRSVQSSRDGRPVRPVKQTFSGPMLNLSTYGTAQAFLFEELVDFSDFSGGKTRWAEYRLTENDGRTHELKVDLSGLRDALGQGREMLGAASVSSRRKGNAPEVCENVVPVGTGAGPSRK